MKDSLRLLTERGIAAARVSCAAAILSLYAACATAGAFLDPDGKIGELTWRSSNSTFDGLQFSLENHYVRLANLGLLDTTVQTWPSGINFPSTFFDNFFPYLNWTSKIDNLMCDLNSHVCTRPRTIVEDPAVEGIDHVFGNAFTLPNESRWSIAEGTSLIIPITSVDAFVSWTGYNVSNEIANLQDGWLRALYRDAALGCTVQSSAANPSTVSSENWTLLGSSESSLREALRNGTPPDCPSWIARQNAYWLSYVATLSGIYSSDKDPNSAYDPSHRILNEIAVIDRLSMAGQVDRAWLRLEDMITEILSSEARLPSRIELPVISAASDHLIYRATDTSTLAYGKTWRQRTEPLTLAERLAKLDTALYLSSLIEAAPTIAPEVVSEAPKTASEIEAQIREANERIQLIQRELKGAPIVKGTAGVAVRGIGNAEGVWTFNATNGSLFPDGYANKQHHEMIGFSPSIAPDPGFFQSPIILVEKNYDKEHCIFVGHCDVSRFEIVDRKSLSNIETMQMVETERDRLKRVREDLLDRENGFSFHGNGVAAIALANPESGLMHGIFPHARPIPVDIDIASDFILQDSWDIERRELFGPPTWNISAQTPEPDNVRGIKDIIARQLGDDYNRTMRDIFVVSGGHLENSEIARALAGLECEVYPACLVTNAQFRRSVIAVVGVTRDDNGRVVVFSEGEEPTAMAAFRHPEFQIAAPAEGIIVPTVDPFMLTTVSGVSFAAPMVSATVAAMRSRPQIIPASHVIARIMACGVQYQSLTSAVQSGVLDFSCSVEFARDLVSFRKDYLNNEDPAYETLREGRVLRIWQDGLDNPRPSDVINFTQGTSVQGDWRARPVIGDSVNAIFGIRKFGDSSNELKVTGIQGANKSVVTDFRGPLDSNLVMEFQPLNADGTLDGPPVCFRLSELRDYIPAATSVADSWRLPAAPRCAH